MRVIDILEKRRRHLQGRCITPEEANLLRGMLVRSVPEWLITLMSDFRLAGSEFVLSAQLDESTLGVSMRWLMPSEIVSEATEAYPGIAAIRFDYLPIGVCLLGSGDPYFIKLGPSDDPPLVRIPHEAIDSQASLICDHVERVSSSLSVFLEQASIG